MNAIKKLKLLMVGPLLLFAWVIWFLIFHMKMVFTPLWWTTGTWKSSRINFFGTACGILGVLIFFATLLVFILDRIYFGIAVIDILTSDTKGGLNSAIGPYLIGLAFVVLPLTIFTMLDLDDIPTKPWWWLAGWVLVALSFVAFLIGSWRVVVFYNFLT